MSRPVYAHQAFFDIHPVTGASIEVFYADRSLETFGWQGAGWFWWPRQRGFAPTGPGIGPFPTSYSAYRAAVLHAGFGVQFGDRARPQNEFVGVATQPKFVAESMGFESTVLPHPGFTACALSHSVISADACSKRCREQLVRSERSCSLRWLESRMCWLVMLNRREIR